jgi:YHS domain-containing protein
MKMRTGILFMMVLFFSVSNSFAEEMKVAQDTVKELKDVNNKICPVDGAKIGSMGEGVKVEHEGKTYMLCCADCIKAFNEDPEKFHKIADSESQVHGEDKHSHGEHAHDEHDKK